jgi:hypothetical protein
MEQEQVSITDPFGMEVYHGGDNVERNRLHVTVGMLFARKNLAARDRVLDISGDSHFVCQPIRFHQT